MLVHRVAHTSSMMAMDMMGLPVPTSLPAGMVDEDNTATTRKLCQVIDAMELTDIRYKYHSFSEAHEAMRRGDIYGFFYIPPRTTEQALASRQPRVSFYTNDSYHSSAWPSSARNCGPRACVRTT